MTTPHHLLPVFSGVEAGSDGNTNNTAATKSQPKERLEEVHPYMSLYYPILISSIAEAEQKPSNTESHNNDELFSPNSIRTSSLQKRPVEYATRIYITVDAGVGVGSRSSTRSRGAIHQGEIIADKKVSAPSSRISSSSSSRSISWGANKQTEFVPLLPPRGTEDEHSKLWNKKRRKRRRSIATPPEPVRHRFPKQKRRSASSSLGGYGAGNVEIDGNRDVKKPAMQLATMPARAEENEKYLESAEVLSQRYPRRKRTCCNSPISYGDTEEHSDDVYSDSDFDGNSDIGEIDGDDGNVESNSKTNSKKYLGVIDEKRLKKTGLRKRHEPNGRYAGVDYQQLAKKCTKENHNEDYKKDVITDNGPIRDNKWNAKFRELLAFYRKHGHLNIKARKSALVIWLNDQRKLFKLHHIHPARFNRLSSLGFRWVGGRPGRTWMDSFQKLVNFKKKHGHPDVPKRYKDSLLASWVKRNRAIYNHKHTCQLRKEQIDCMESIGFNWVARQCVWNNWVKELSKFKKKHNHFRVPVDYPNGLNRWAQLRREEYARNKLKEEHIAMLNKIGFDWKI
jgi:hypothetical protein